MTNSKKLQWVRDCRNQRLLDTEQWGYGVSDRPWPEGWTEYRQALRDIPAKVESGEIPYPDDTDGMSFNWPQMPQSFLDLQNLPH